MRDRRIEHLIHEGKLKRELVRRVKFETIQKKQKKRYRIVNVKADVALLDKLLCLEVATQVEHLPDGQAEQAAHTEDAEVKYLRVGRF